MGGPAEGTAPLRGGVRSFKSPGVLALQRASLLPPGAFCSLVQRQGRVLLAPAGLPWSQGHGAALERSWARRRAVVGRQHAPEPVDAEDTEPLTLRTERLLAELMVVDAEGAALTEVPWLTVGDMYASRGARKGVRSVRVGHSLEFDRAGNGGSRVPFAS